jgi:Cu2+-exporting ATPase
MAIPIAAGVLYPAYGIELRPEWSALLMSLSSIIVAVNAVLLKRVESDLAPTVPHTSTGANHEAQLRTA